MDPFLNTFLRDAAAAVPSSLATYPTAALLALRSSATATAWAPAIVVAGAPVPAPSAAGSAAASSSAKPSLRVRRLGAAASTDEMYAKWSSLDI